MQLTQNVDSADYEDQMLLTNWTVIFERMSPVFRMLCRILPGKVLSTLRYRSNGHSTHSLHASQHIRHSDMLFLSEASE